MNPSYPKHSEPTSTEPSSAVADPDPSAGLALEILEPRFGICRLDPKARFPRWLHRSSFISISRSRDELSLVCEEKLIPETMRSELGWRAIQVLGPLDFSMIGVLEALAVPLARANVSIFCISTFDTDYLLVRDKFLARAVAALEEAGHRFDAQPLVPEAAAPEPAPAEVKPEAASQAEPRDGREPEEDLEPTQELEPIDLVPAAETEAEEDLEPTQELEPIDLAPAAETEAEEDLEPTQELEPVDLQPAAESAEEPEPAPPEFEQPVSAESPADQPETRPKRRERVANALSELFTKHRGAPNDEAAEATAVAAGDAVEPSEDVRETAASENQPSDRREASKPRRSRIQHDEGADASGLFSGAIPQHDVELTEDTFESLGLSAPILATIRELGFEHPTPIQAGVIPPALEGADIIGLAETGSGKTAAFSLPLAERLTHGRGIRGLILCPTREIALQTKAFLDIFGRDHELETVAIIGGVKFEPQIRGLRRTPDIIVATPGRLADHLRRRNVRLDRLEELVLDEADHMLDLGFLPQIREILEQAPGKRRTMMFSATMPPPIERLTHLFMTDPVRIDFRPSGHVASGIEHRLYLVDEDDRKKCLVQLLKEVPGSTLIFIRRKLYTEWLARQLELAGLEVARIHSDRSQAQRVRALRGFREGKHRILVATDVAARGLDIPRIQHVVNYGLPETVEDYVHRAGRTARGNAAGIVSSIATWQDKIMVRNIEHDLSIKIPRCTVEGVKPYVELKKRKTVRRRRLL